MEVEIERAALADTPASEMSEFVVEHVTALMTLGGIESISSVRFESGLGSRLHVSIAPFPEAPEEVERQGIVIKDALAQILSIANVSRVVMKPTKEDLAGIRKTWNDSVSAARIANGESGQDASVAEGSAL